MEHSIVAVSFAGLVSHILEQLHGHSKPKSRLLWQGCTSGPDKGLVAQLSTVQQRLR
ncbi:hypothetical protein PAMC26577_09555 [Caballeronia sordidicola]|uniref:Uncharacterized protein n=1 Tax=Caballeronia sordidicola TaxID=196367 RepID=A0A242N0V6_CABSO|nr:hypothetical protein PAMC26577_09555 [Caballeronia sordidicola]